jgi:mannose-6-phosphate isomerase-like protein (cupin superfamily)
MEYWLPGLGRNGTGWRPQRSIYIVAGRGRLTVDDSVVAVEPGSVVYVPPGGKQSLENSGPTAIEFLCLVDPAWRPEDEQVLE